MQTIDGYIEYWLPLSVRLEAEFSCLNARVSTTPHGPPWWSGESTEGSAAGGFGYLRIRVAVALDSIDSASEAARFARPRVLILLSLLTYFLKRPFTVFEIKSSQSEKHAVLPVPEDASCDRFVVEGTDLRDSVLSFLRVLAGEDIGLRRLLASLLDRWRKALYLRFEDEEVFADEAILAFFHTLELLASVNDKEIRERVQQKVRVFVEDIYTSLLTLDGSHRTSKTSQRSRELTQMMIGPEDLPVSVRIGYLLEQLGMADARTRGALNALVKTRNAIAHGRQVYQEDVVWPLPAFFPLAPDYYDHVDVVQVMSARAIALWVGCQAWGDEWAKIRQCLPAPPEVLRALLQNGWENLGVESDTRDGLTVQSIAYYWLRNGNRWSLDKLTRAIGPLLRGPDKLDVQEVLLACMFLADSDDVNIAQRAREAVEGASGEVSSSSLKDILREAEFYGHQVVWYRSWLEGS